MKISSQSFDIAFNIYSLSSGGSYILIVLSFPPKSVSLLPFYLFICIYYLTFAVQNPLQNFTGLLQETCTVPLHGFE